VLCGCRQVLGFDDVVPPRQSDAPPGLDGPVLEDAPPAVGVARRIEVIDTKVTGGPHVDFPLMISISDPDFRSTANGGIVENESGFDIVFSSDLVGTSRLAHEIDAYDPVNGNLLAWVKISSLTGGTELFVHYGDPALTTSQENVAQVWSAGYAGVWHLTNLVDSTGHTGAANAIGTTVVAGQLASGRDFTGTDRIEIEAVAANQNVFDGGGTVEAWARPRSGGDGGFGRIADKGTWGIMTGDGNTPNSLQFSRVYASASGNWHTPLDSFAKNQLAHVAASFDTETPNILPAVYIDGVVITTDADVPAGGPLGDGAVKLVIGDRITGDRSYDGVIDELRISNVVRSAGWIATEFANQLDPTSFLVLSPPL
jgi:hypothetical protein